MFDARIPCIFFIVKCDQIWYAMRMSPLFFHPSHVIIGIHGLKNKPPKRLLKAWWIASLREGLRLAGLPDRVFQFELVYWANHLYSKPLNIHEKRPGNPLYLDEPYAPTLRTKNEKEKEKKSFLFRPLFRKTLNKVFMNTKTGRDAERITETVLEHTFPDLVLYFDNEHVFNMRKGIKELLRYELIKVLKKYKKSKIMLIAHSMGSIIAFDVLYSTESVVHVFVTIGSPLGLPFVRSRFMKEHSMDFKETRKIQCPDTVLEQWINCADTHDVVAFDSTLSDNYSANSRGVLVQDMIVDNNYIYNDKPDYHSVYGYLRCKELAILTDAFLCSKGITMFEKIVLWWRKKTHN